MRNKINQYFMMLTENQLSASFKSK